LRICVEEAAYQASAALRTRGFHWLVVAVGGQMHPVHA
jgi:hypothetical protein